MLLALVIAFSTEAAQAHGQLSLSDPPRAGGPIDGLTPEQVQNFNTGRLFFGIPHSVQGTEPGAPVNGLGPTFNHNACLACHSHPGPGGSSPPVNPQVAIATQFGANNRVPFFVKPNGPVREVRFKRKPDGTPDGGVHQIYTISGRADAVGCVVPQPDFVAEARNNNLSFRIPTPIFGGGLIERISDADILANMNSQLDEKRRLGIAGRENRSDNDGTITRFGWKAQNPSLEVFAGEAYNVEQGVTNDLFQVKRTLTPTCNFNRQPEDSARFDVPSPFSGLSAVAAFTLFSKFLAPPQRGPETPSSRNGEALFTNIGCALCHTPQMTTGSALIDAFDHKPVNLYSDLIVHRMGPGLADYISQGRAGADEFRTAPLWGVGQRLFFLHDGRASNLIDAIRAHASNSTSVRCNNADEEPETGVACRSEANGVIRRFNRLTAQEREDVVNFLKTL
jgi:CxxC motif-containing protein (DUF1111 family)